MYQCELFSVKKSTEDYEQLTASQREVRAVLEQEGVTLKGLTPIAADPHKIADAVRQALQTDSADLFLFANALNTTDHSAFRKLFYELISLLESSVKAEDNNLKIKLKVISLKDLGEGYPGYCFSLRDKRFVVLPYASLTGKSITDLIAQALQKSETALSLSRRKYSDGVAYMDKDGSEADPAQQRLKDGVALTAPQQQGFFRSFIPLKSDTKKLKIRKSIVLVAIAVFIGALIYVLNFFVFGPMHNNAITSEIQSIAYNGGDGGSEQKDGGPAQDWKALKKINKEIVGWITIPDTVVDYPVLEHKGDDRYNQYYINRSYKKDGTEYGSIFIDYRSSDSVNSRNVIMHGHNMRDGSQFHTLMNYSHEGDLKGDLSYYKKHPVIIFNTPDGDAKYKIISVFKTSTRYEHGEFFNYMQGEFTSDAEFMNFVYNVRARSMFNLPVTCNEDDQIITLSTCCYEFYQWRCVVVARKVRSGEDESVDVELATLNPSPLFPDVYYQRYGGERPDPGTFKSADAAGKIDWYDGKGNLEGSEELTATLASNPTEAPTEKPKPGEKPATEPPQITYYQVTYRNYDGSQYEAYNVREGDPVPTPSGTPTMPDDDYYTYTFTGWNKDVAGVDFEHLNVSLDIYPSFIGTLK